MKKLIIISDTHGGKKEIEKLTPLIAENDYVVHLGDGAADMRDTMKNYPEKVYISAGNCDFLSPYPTEGVLEVERVRILYCHGHKYGVKRDLSELAQAAKAHDCDIALYGHTHEAKISVIDGVTLINPGTLHYPLEAGGSYCYLVVHEKQVTPSIIGQVANRR